MWTSETYGPRLAYLGLGIAAGALAYAKFQPREESYIAVATKVETRVEVKEVERVKWKEKLVSKVVTKPDGTRIESQTTSRGQEQRTSVSTAATEVRGSVSTSQTTTSQASRFVLGASHLLPPWSGCAPCWTQVSVLVGARVGSLPLFLTLQNPTTRLSPALGVAVEF